MPKAQKSLIDLDKYTESDRSKNTKASQIMIVANFYRKFEKSFISQFVIWTVILGGVLFWAVIYTYYLGDIAQNVEDIESQQELGLKLTNFNNSEELDAEVLGATDEQVQETAVSGQDDLSENIDGAEEVSQDSGDLDADSDVSLDSTDESSSDEQLSQTYDLNSIYSESGTQTGVIVAQADSTDGSDGAEGSVDPSIERDQKLREALQLDVPSEIDNPNYSIFFTDPSGKGVDIQLDGQGFEVRQSPYVLPAISIGEHVLDFRFEDSTGVKQDLQIRVILIPRAPYFSSEQNTIFDTGDKITISGTALPNSTLIIFVTSANYSQSVTVDGEGLWEISLDASLEKGEHTAVAFVRKSGYASNFSDVFTFTVGKSGAGNHSDNNNNDSNIFIIISNYLNSASDQELIIYGLSGVLAIIVLFQILGIIRRAVKKRKEKKNFDFEHQVQKSKQKVTSEDITNALGESKMTLREKFAMLGYSVDKKDLDKQEDKKKEKKEESTHKIEHKVKDEEETNESQKEKISSSKEHQKTADSEEGLSKASNSDVTSDLAKPVVKVLKPKAEVEKQDNDDESKTEKEKIPEIEDEEKEQKDDLDKESKNKEEKVEEISDLKSEQKVIDKSKSKNKSKPESVEEEEAAKFEPKKEKTDKNATNEEKTSGINPFSSSEYTYEKYVANTLKHGDDVVEDKDSKEIDDKSEIQNDKKNEKSKEKKGLFSFFFNRKDKSKKDNKSEKDVSMQGNNIGVPGKKEDAKKSISQKNKSIDSEKNSDVAKPKIGKVYSKDEFLKKFSDSGDIKEEKNEREESNKIKITLTSKK